MEISLTVSMPVGGDDGTGTLEELDFRHALERRLDAALRARALGRVGGGGAGLGRQEIFMLVDHDHWRMAWEAVRLILEDQGVLGRPGLQVTLQDHPVTQVLCLLPLGLWQLQRLTAGELASLVDQLRPLVSRALAHYVHMDPDGDQAALATAAETVDALQDLLDAAVAAWATILDPAAAPDRGA